MRFLEDPEPSLAALPVQHPRFRFDGPSVRRPGVVVCGVIAVEAVPLPRSSFDKSTVARRVRCKLAPRIFSSNRITETFHCSRCFRDSLYSSRRHDHYARVTARKVRPNMSTTWSL